MFCSRCGHGLPDGAKYCDSCGSAVVASTAPIASAAPASPAAGPVPVPPTSSPTPMPPAAGPAPMPPAASPTPFQTQDPGRQQAPRKGPNPSAIVAVVVVLAILVVGGVFFLRAHGGEDPVPATPAASPRQRTRARHNRLPTGSTSINASSTVTSTATPIRKS